MYLTERWQHKAVRPWPDPAFKPPNAGKLIIMHRRQAAPYRWPTTVKYLHRLLLPPSPHFQGPANQLPLQAEIFPYSCPKTCILQESGHFISLHNHASHPGSPFQLSRAVPACGSDPFIKFILRECAGQTQGRRRAIQRSDEPFSPAHRRFSNKFL